MPRSVIFLLLFAPLSTLGDGLTIEPGRYENTMTRTNPMTGLTTTDVSEECVEEARVFTPEQMLDEAEDCEMLQSSTTSESMEFAMTCGMGGGEGRFIGNFEKTDAGGSGEMKLEMKLGDFNMKMEMDWQSRRLGDC